MLCELNLELEAHLDFRVKVVEICAF